MFYPPFYSNVLAAIFFKWFSHQIFKFLTRHLFQKNFPAIFFKCFTRHLLHIFWVTFPNVSPTIWLEFLPTIIPQMLGPHNLFKCFICLFKWNVLPGFTRHFYSNAFLYLPPPPFPLHIFIGIRWPWTKKTRIWMAWAVSYKFLNWECLSTDPQDPSNPPPPP
jgi:hypothetical protein